MKFCAIYKIVNNGINVTITNVVSCRNLTDEQFDSLADYFEEITHVSNFTELGMVSTFYIRNKDEVLEDSPLPDGTIVRDKEFEENGEYLIALGHAGIYAGKVKVVLDLEI